MCQISTHGARRAPLSSILHRLTVPQPRRRRFHASAQKLFVAEALELSHSVFTAVHDYSGFSWALCIPITAILFRLSFSPVQFWITRNQQKKQIYLPQLRAWKQVHQEQAIAKFADLPKTSATAEIATKWVEGQMKQRATALAKKYDVGNRIFEYSGFAFLPIWIFNIDVIRGMAGAQNTLFGGYSIAEKAAFHTDGMLWFPDLTGADPTWLLPLAFGAIQYTNLWLGGGFNDSKRRLDIKRMPPGNEKARTVAVALLGKAIRSVMLLSPFWLIYIQAPTGVMLYLTASAMVPVAQRPIIRYLVGWKPPIEPAHAMVARRKKKQ